MVFGPLHSPQARPKYVLHLSYCIPTNFAPIPPPDSKPCKTIWNVPKTPRLVVLKKIYAKFLHALFIFHQEKRRLEIQMKKMKRRVFPFPYLKYFPFSNISAFFRVLHRSSLSWLTRTSLKQKWWWASLSPELLSLHVLFWAAMCLLMDIQHN